MSQDFDSKKATSHLKLVVSNPDLVQEKAPNPSKSALSPTGFTAEVSNIGSQIYEMTIRDPFHDLECDLSLEIEKDRREWTVICHFPDIMDESSKFLDDDETLYGTIMVQFQLKVLEQLFLFCSDHKASQLSIYMDAAPAEGFEIYHQFLAQQDQNLTTDGEQTAMVIATNPISLDQLRGFMKESNHKLEQDLWREQCSNPVIRDYLKSVKAAQ